MHTQGHGRSGVNRCASPAGAPLSFTAKLTTSARWVSVLSHLNCRGLALNQHRYDLHVRSSRTSPAIKSGSAMKKNKPPDTMLQNTQLKQQMTAAERCKCFSVFPNVPPNTTRHTMHWGTALPLTSCSNKAEGHSSCQRCSQRLAWRTNGGLFSVLPPPCCPARPHSTRGGQRRCVCRCLVRWHDDALHCGFFNFFHSSQTSK